MTDENKQQKMIDDNEDDKKTCTWSWTDFDKAPPLFNNDIKTDCDNNITFQNQQK